MCNGPFQRSAYPTDQTQGNQTGPRLYVNAWRGPYLGNAPYPLLFGAQRNAEFDQGGRAVQRITAGSEPSHQGPRNRTRWRVASARAHAVAPDGTWPAHAPYAAPVLRNSPCGQDGCRIYQEGCDHATLGGGHAHGGPRALRTNAAGVVAGLPGPSTEVASRLGPRGRRIPEIG